MKRNNDSLKFKRLDWYIIKEVLGYLPCSWIALIISIAVVFDINEKIDKFMTHSATLHGIIFDYYLNFIPYYTKPVQPPVRLPGRHLLHLQGWPATRRSSPSYPTGSVSSG